ncbi:hypothetical protein J2T13_004527 [Paenibacillus sp. DS2015]|uniref:hypothetical protein n=1 Tax=Paenibacillus sp. DS2015 TaxID=3373917 RepID=UPI003D25874C
MSNQLSRVESLKKRRLEEKSKPLLQRVTRKVTDTADVKETVSSPAIDTQNDDQEPVPARTDTYSSQRMKLSKIFLNTLIVLFFLLTIGLVWWGIEGAPDWKEMW